jgi:hypothetical protein
MLKGVLKIFRSICSTYRNTRANKPGLIRGTQNKCTISTTWESRVQLQLMPTHIWSRRLICTGKNVSISFIMSVCLSVCPSVRLSVRPSVNLQRVENRLVDLKNWYRLPVPEFVDMKKFLFHSASYNVSTAWRLKYVAITYALHEDPHTQLVKYALREGPHTQLVSTHCVKTHIRS